MPRDSSGNYTQPVSTVSPAVPNTTISSTDFNTLTTDLSTELTDSLDRSGKGAMLSNLAMGAFKIQNLGAPATNSDAARLDTITTASISGDVTGTPPSTVVANVPANKVTGLTTGSFSANGKVGEVIAASATVNMPNGTTQGIVQLTLTPGNWYLFAQVQTIPGGSPTTSGLNAVIGLTSGTLTAVNNASINLQVSFSAGQGWQAPVGGCVQSITASAIYYVNGSVNFAGGTMQMFARVTAIRIG
jgi:hypothetical protein